MRILFDDQKFSLQRYGGITRYFANLCKGLNKEPGFTGTVSALYSENEYIKDCGLLLNNSFGSSLFHHHGNRIIRWNRRFSRLIITLNNFDVFHPTYYDPYFIKDIKKPFVITVHDMIHELMPTLFPDSKEVINQKMTVINASDSIIAISEHTKNEIIRFYPNVENKISMVYHGYSSNNVVVGNDQLPNLYILYVGERWHYKNFIPFVMAISKLLNQNNQLKLICAGGGKFNDTEIETLNKLNIRNQCVQINATDIELNQLYKNATLFAFPSIQEGFGLPLLEAFANNCAVACSNTSSLPEIANGAAIFFDPHDDISMLGAIEKLLYDERLQQNLKDRGQKRLQSFTFANCLNSTIKVYESLL